MKRNGVDLSDLRRASGNMHFEVVIIGASTAGLHAAAQLASAGKRVAVFDRKKELSPARRTLIVTSQMHRVLPIPPSAVLHETGTLRVAVSGAATAVRLQEPDLVIERSEITRWLLARAEAEGVQVFLGSRFTGLEVSDVQVEVLFRSGSDKKRVTATEAIIGADGIKSNVGRAAAICQPPSVPIVQAEVTLPSGWDPDVTQVWFDADDTNFFYWLIPESSVRGVVGLVGSDGTQTQRLLARFLGHHRLKAEAYQGAKVALHHPRLRPWGRIGELPILMVGDAAGQVKVTTVGGTVTGIEGANAAARAILKRTSYRHELSSLKRELDLHWFIRVMLDRLDNRGYCVLVDSLSSRLRDFLGRHNRDSMAPVSWRLPFVQPRLCQVAVRCLWGRSRASLRNSGPVKSLFTEVES